MHAAWQIWEIIGERVMHGKSDVLWLAGRSCVQHQCKDVELEA